LKVRSRRILAALNLLVLAISLPVAWVVFEPRLECHHDHLALSITGDRFRSVTIWFDPFRIVTFAEP
jgi:hypothetical protein